MNIFQRLFAVAALCSAALPSAAIDPSVEKKVTAALLGLAPNAKIDSITASALPDIYQVLLGTEVLYVTGDGRFVFRGELYDLDEQVELTDVASSEVRAKILKTVRAGEYIEFAAAKPRHAVYVFTDVDCGYCRKLHMGIEEYNKLGISVRYLAYPRSGVESLTGKKMQGVWCAGDRKKALTLSKQGQPVTSESCENPVARQFKMGSELGVTGTPAIFTEAGKNVGGYLPAPSLLEGLDKALNNQ